ncbi:MAG: hypothetical protein JWO09_937 [Bacteroidetes bacterium]|nr:hypothetical protein [Bacteroidota bacterium]
MLIEFVNHSSFIIEHKGTRIMCDPWLEGNVFNNGWSLLSPTLFSYNDFEHIDYIWFSHEHPDHFFPPNLKKIPSEFRARITILFQYTKDKRVADWCKKQGFKEVIELYPNRWQNVTDDLNVLCEHFDEGDSWICFRSDTETFLNTNDCGITNSSQAMKIKEKTGKIDLLLTQFSYAYWAGNPEQREYRKQVANDKLGWMKQQCDAFEPKYVIPIASYIYFSHAENEYLNDEINTAGKTYEFIKANTKVLPVVLYNGDKFEMDQPHDSQSAIDRYAKDLAFIRQKNVYGETRTIAPEQLQSEAEAFLKSINNDNSFYLKWNIKPSSVFVKDYNKSYTLSLSGFEPSQVAEDACDVSITSENLSFCFLYPYGLDTTQINGRLRKPLKGSYSRFFNFFRINQLKSRGTNPNSLSYLLAAASRKVLGKLGFYKP